MQDSHAQQPVPGVSPEGDQDQNELGNQGVLEKLRSSAGPPGDLPHGDDVGASLGADLSGLDVYTGLGDGLKALGVNALALGGEALLFADASPDVETVAHEAAHAVQAGAGTPVGESTTTAGDSSEQEANAAGAAVARGESFDVTGSTDGAMAGDTGGAVAGGIIGGLIGGPAGAIVGGLIGDALTDPTPEEEMAEFRSNTFSPLLDHSASSGGLFDVYLNPAAGTLRINLKVGYSFVAGDPSKVAPGFPAEEFEWTSEEEEAWRTQYQSEVSAQWSGQHQFQSTKEGWSMSINCAVEVTQDDADPHYVLTVSKYPDDAEMVTSSITPKGSSDSGTGEMDSNDIRPEQKLDWANTVHQIQFDKGSTTLDGTAQGKVSNAAGILAAIPNVHIQITGRASSDYPSTMDASQGAEHNMALARGRSAAVETGLVGGGLAGSSVLVRNVGHEGATEAEEWCRVDAQGGTQEMQSPGLHETGHMFGLGDEYATSSNPAGSAVRRTYDAILRDQLGLTITRGKTDSAMGSGSTVRNWHYVTFLEALKEISGMPEWTV